MRTEILPAADQHALQRALQVLRRGGLVSFPTDTVYGLGSLAFDGPAVSRLFQAKGRSAQQAVPVLLGDLAELERLASPVTHALRRLAKRFWPGALTLVVRKSQGLPSEISPDRSIGLRMPDHRLALDLLIAAGPLAVTSANRSGAPSVTTAGQVMNELGGRVNLILDGGEAPGGEPSTVVDLTDSPPRLLRAGPISLEEVLRYLETG